MWPRKADLAFARPMHTGVLGAVRVKGRDEDAGEEPAMVTMVTVEVVDPTTSCGRSEHLRDRPHSSK